MPTYEYRCPDGHEFERFFRKISDAPSDVACPVCGKVAERRMSAGAGLLFKGSGFYLTDYGKNAHRGDKAASGDSKTGGETSSESKAAESSGAKPAESKAADAKPASAPPAPAPVTKPKSDK